jgi:hypothetical protein
VDVGRMHMHLGGEQQTKAKEDPRNATTSKVRDMLQCTSPPTKWTRVTEMTLSSSEDAEEYGDGCGMTDKEQSWRYVLLSPPKVVVCCLQECRMGRSHA